MATKAYFYNIPDDIILHIFNFLDKPWKKNLAPFDSFAVVGPRYSGWKIKEKTLIKCSLLNQRFYWLVNRPQNWNFVSYYSKKMYTLNL
jgi:hypothetical protein